MGATVVAKIELSAKRRYHYFASNRMAFCWRLNYKTCKYMQINNIIILLLSVYDSFSFVYYLLTIIIIVILIYYNIFHSNECIIYSTCIHIIHHLTIRILAKLYYYTFIYLCRISVVCFCRLLKNAL